MSPKQKISENEMIKIVASSENDHSQNEVLKEQCLN